jgi:hypothetical protein
MHAASVPHPMVSPGPIQHVAAPTAPADPIDENPNASWYVRPPSGGQYGPARGPVMRKWIGEGRVSSDSLVWREGWTDWLDAHVVFPELKTGTALQKPTTSGPLLDTTSVSNTSNTTKRTTARKNSSPTTAVAIVVFLAFMAVGLLIALFYVLSQTQHSSNKKPTTRQAAARCVASERVL